MSHELPAKPNLEHLKKQAKELLRTMPQGKLADAQHALAIEYGFATWAKLKAHVEAHGLSPAESLEAAVRASDASRVRELLKRHPDLHQQLQAKSEAEGGGPNVIDYLNRHPDVRQHLIDLSQQCAP